MARVGPLRSNGKRVASFWLEKATCDLLDVVSGRSGLARGKLVEAALTHKVGCDCEACLALGLAR